MKRIVVLGGSFNPPTVAHLKLLSAACDAVCADKGYFVPAPAGYVRRKLKKQGIENEFFGDEYRLEALYSLTKADSRLAVFEGELGKKTLAVTYETLDEISAAEPDSELYFIAGGDKLHIIPKWRRIDEFLSRFKILIANRNGENPEKVIEKYPLLREHRDMLVVFDAPEDIDEISSSKFRTLFLDGDCAAEKMVTDEVFAIAEKWKKTYDNSIDSFSGKYRFLSNFYDAPVEFCGITYKNSEAAFQAQKCTDEEQKRAFSELEPQTAKRKGKTVELRGDWEEVKVQLMHDILLAKFTQNEDLKEMLIATGDACLKEGNTWHDTFWGVDLKTGKGENLLGKTLMQVRDEINKTS